MINKIKILIIIFCFYLLFSIIISIILLSLSYLLTHKNIYHQKITAYECGFATINNPTQPFSIRFFMIGIIFLIFDLEILYILPWSIFSGQLTLINQAAVILFFFFVVGGLIYEYKKGGLEWF